MAYPDRYLLFIEYFNNLRFTSAQSTLDELWLDETSHTKQFYGGLVQLAVSMYHLTTGNAPGAKKIFEKAQSMLEPFGEKHMGIQIQPLLQQVHALFSQSPTEGQTHIDYLAKVPRIIFEDTLDA